MIALRMTFEDIMIERKKIWYEEFKQVGITSISTVDGR
jgi:hypothetical protein